MRGGRREGRKRDQRSPSFLERMERNGEEGLGPPAWLGVVWGLRMGGLTPEVRGAREKVMGL